MNVVKKKIWPEYFEKVKSGGKKVEIRLSDFDIKEGDVLELQEYNPKTKKYTGRSIKKKVTYLSNTKTMEKMHSKEEINKYGLYIIQLEDEK